MNSPVFRLTFVILSLTFFFGDLPWSAAAELDQQVTEMLDAAWKPSPTGLKTAEGQYQQLTEQNPGDARLKFAYALLLLKNRRYDDATKLLGEILAVHKNYVPARRARVWSAVLTKQYPAAILDMEALSQSLPADTTTAHEPEWIDLAAFLGRMAGFLEGPAEASEHSLQGFPDKVTAGLRGDRLAAYTKAHREVSDKFAGYGLNQQQTKAAGKVAAEEKKVQITQEVADEKVNLEADKTSLKAEAEKLMADQQREVAALEAKARPLQQNIARLQAEVQTRVRLFSLLQDQLAVAQNATRNTIDYREQKERRIITPEDRVRQAQSAINREDFALRQMNGQIAMLSNQLAVLEQASLTTLAKYGVQGQRVEKRAGDLVKGEKRLAITEKTLTRPTSASTPQSRALAIAAAALTTYDEFPFEHMRQRLLDSLRGQK